MPHPHLASLLTLSLLTSASSTDNITRHNILHIISDDLRPDLGCYGLPSRHTPNLDNIAATGTVFTRAYAQQAVCGPSRNSFLSGRRPDRSRSWNFINHFRESHKDWTSLPGLFAKDEHFVSLGAGKTYHPKLPPSYDGNASWSKAALPYKNPCWNTADDPNAKFQDGGLPCFFCNIDILSRLFPKKYNTSVADEFCDVDAYEDVLSVWNGVELLKKHVPKDKFFYLAVGMHKPHLPWQYAKEDLELHPIDSVAPAKHTLPPTNVPMLALQFTDKSIHESPYDVIPVQAAVGARRAYRATITGMDRKLKPLLDALKEVGKYNNTAIVFHSDHGWHLGELGEWRKFTNFEIATQVPLIISVPWLKRQPLRSNALVELVDIWPTIAELSGVSIPKEEPEYDGVSLVSLLSYEEGEESGGIDSGGWNKTYALSQYPRLVRHPDKAWSGNSIIHRNRSLFTHMGYTVRTNEWRYTEWAKWNGTLLVPIWSPTWDSVVNELYNHQNDTIFPINFDSDSETMNVVKLHDDVARKLSSLIRREFPTTTTTTMETLIDS